MTTIIDGTSGISTPMYNGSITANPVTPSVNMKNRIINGAMVIDQRNAGASVTVSSDNQYDVDRWSGWGAGGTGGGSKYSLQQNAGSVTPPINFYNYLGATSLSSYSVQAGDYYAVGQAIEGLNTLDLNWGTANAQTVTLSFWVRSSLTGTFGGALQNSARNRCYPFSYTISSANTWEQKSITITGETTGTWTKTNGVGILLVFGLGVGSTYSGTAGAWSTSNLWSATGATSVVGTNGATFYITGVQLEVGSTASSFDYRPYGTELALCQRYFSTTYNTGVAVGSVSSLGAIYRTLDAAQSYASLQWQLPVKMRATPTTTYYSPFSGTSGKMGYNPGSVDVTTGNAGVDGMQNVATIINGISIGQSYGLYLHLTCSAEL